MGTERSASPKPGEALIEPPMNQASLIGAPEALGHDCVRPRFGKGLFDDIGTSHCAHNQGENTNHENHGA